MQVYCNDFKMVNKGRDEVRETMNRWLLSYRKGDKFDWLGGEKEQCTRVEYDLFMGEEQQSGDSNSRRAVHTVWFIRDTVKFPVWLSLGIFWNFPYECPLFVPYLRSHFEGFRPKFTWLTLVISVPWQVLLVAHHNYSKKHVRQIFPAPLTIHKVNFLANVGNCVP